VDASPLDAPVWHSLTGAHAAVAQVRGAARRYPPDVSVFAALGDDGPDAWADLAALVDGAEVTLVGAEPAAPPRGWRVVRTGAGHQLVAEALVPPQATAAAPAVVPLGPGDAERMGALVALAQPGPWRPRTVELGHYVGVVDGGRLLAMAGQRMRPPGHVEISAVCTHPDARGRGYGAAVTRAVTAAVLAAGDVAFLHVAEGNDRARRLYERLGFRHRRRVVFTTLAPPAAA